MTIQIPREYTPLFKDFFTDFDDDLEMLEIQTYGMSVTTLEQVFLEIGNNPNPKPKIGMAADVSQESREPDDSPRGAEFMNQTPDLPDLTGKSGESKVVPIDAMIAHEEVVTNQEGTSRMDDSTRQLMPEEEKKQANERSFLPPIKSIGSKDQVTPGLKRKELTEKQRNPMESLVALAESKDEDSLAPLQPS